MNTPKVQRRISLSLKRLNGSNQKIVLSGIDTPCSPSVKAICSERNFHTPPHRKLNWDENTDYSPKLFDTSFSPNALLSQSLAIESPEVGWRWTEETLNSNCTDSSYTSAGSSSVESKTVRTRGDMQRQRLAQLKRDEQRREMEIEMRRAEKMRVDEMLKMRCAKFQEHLKSTESQNDGVEMKLKDNTVKAIAEPNKESNTQKRISIDLFDSGINNVHTSPQIILKTPTRENNPTTNDTFVDFLNDSDSDCFLIEATNQLESQIVELTQNAPANVTEPVKPQSVVTPTSSCKEKRSSFYMKFLEEDSAEDWFDSLEDVIKEATQAKKTRTSLQRYNSMPVTTTSSLNSDSAGIHTVTTTTSILPKTANTNSSTNIATMKMKRHSSSHSLSPGSSSSRRNTLRLRK